MSRRRVMKNGMMEHIIEYTTTEPNQEIKLIHDFAQIDYFEDYDTNEEIELIRTYPTNNNKPGIYKTYVNPGVHRILFKWKKNLTSLGSVFYLCDIYKYPEDIFYDLKYIITINNVFQKCLNITQNIPENLFSKNIALKTINGIFSDCTNMICEVPENIFYYNTQLKALNNCFNNSGITKISTNIFKNNSKLIELISTFRICLKLTFEITTDFFKNIPNIEKLDHTFGYCNSGKITGIISREWFKCMPKLSYCHYTFHQCAISGDFTYDTLWDLSELETFTCLSSTKVNVIWHKDMFKNNSKLTNLGSFPPYATGQLPNELFKYNSLLTIIECFSTSFETTIPEDLLNYTPLLTRFSFNGNTKLYGEIPPNLFALCPNLTILTHCFNGCSKLTGSIPENLFANNSQLTTIHRCFDGCRGLTGTIPENLIKHLTELTDTYGLFSGCSGLSGSFVNGDFFPIDSKITNMSYFFNDCSGLIGTLDKEFFKNLRNVKNLSSFYKNCVNLNGNIPSDLFEYIETKNTITAIVDFFIGCSSLTGTIPSSLFIGFDKLININSFFYKTNVEGIEEGFFENISNVTSLQAVFGYCENLIYDITNLPKNITSIGYECFWGCKKVYGDINQPNLIGNLTSTVFSESGINSISNLGKITTIKGSGNQKSPFLNCTSLVSVILPETITEFSQSSLFSGCNNLQTINIPTKITILPNKMFYNCSKLNLDLSSLKDRIVSIGNSCFTNCTNLNGEVDFPNLTNTEFNSTFSGSGIRKVLNIGNRVTRLYATFLRCPNLVYIECPSSINECEFTCFSSCPSLKVLKLNSINPPTFSRALENTPTDNLKIYVPDESVENYKIADGWSTYSNIIFPISEYIEGEEDN